MILETKKLCFSYDHRSPVLRDVDLGIEKGSVTLLMGPNGSGKTTLLDCLMGALKPSGGTVELLGKPIGKYRPAQLARHIAYIPQIHAVTFPYTVRQVVMMGRMSYAGLFGAPGREDEEACDRAMALVGADKFADQPYSLLSGGEIRLVLLARALCQKAQIILMDEPTAYLDFHNEMLFLERTADMVRQQGLTVVMATHSPNHGFYFEESGVSASAVLISRGRVVRHGAPGDVICGDSIAGVFGVEAHVSCDGGYRSVSIRRALKDGEI